MFRNSGGFVFIDAIFMTLIVSFMAILAANGIQAAIKTNQQSALRTAAINIANGRLDEIQYSAMTEDVNFPAAPDNSSGKWIDSNGELQYENFLGIDGTITFKVTEDIQSLGNDVYRVTVRVYWFINKNVDTGAANDNYEELTKNILLKNSES